MKIPKTAKTQDIFKKVHLSEKKLIFREMAIDKKILILKDDKENVFYLTAFKADENGYLYCAQKKDEALIVKEQEIVANFEMNDERYFFKTKLFIENTVPILKCDVDLFQLQRRANARIDLPNEYNANANIIELNQKTVFFTDLKIKDISAGGCKIFFPKVEPVLKIEDKVKVIIHLGNRRPIQQYSEVRFSSVSPTGQMFGIQFLERDAILENRLLMLMMDLQRELYIKFGT